MLSLPQALTERPALNAWLRHQLQCEHWQLKALSGDASFRQYYRCYTDTNTWIISFEPSQDCQVTQTCNALQTLSAAQIPVPQVLAYDATLGISIQEDLGDTTLWHLRQTSQFDQVADKALDVLHAWQTQTRQPWPEFNQAYMLQECQLLPDWFVPWSGQSWQASQQHAYTQLCQKLCQQIAEMPSTCIHRDFHSRNIMWHQQNVYLIDVQDVMQGPLLYDHASLLKDCYIQWPEQRIETHLRKLYQQHEAQFKDWQHFRFCFDSVALQRHLKVAGIFARLAVRDHKTQFLDDLPLTLHYIQSTARRYPAYAILNDLLPTCPKRVE